MAKKNVHHQSSIFSDERIGWLDIIKAIVSYYAEEENKKYLRRLSEKNARKIVAQISPQINEAYFNEALAKMRTSLKLLGEAVVSGDELTLNSAKSYARESAERFFLSGDAGDYFGIAAVAQYIAVLHFQWRHDSKNTSIVDFMRRTREAEISTVVDKWRRKATEGITERHCAKAWQVWDEMKGVEAVVDLLCSRGFYLRSADDGQYVVYDGKQLAFSKAREQSGNKPLVFVPVPAHPKYQDGYALTVAGLGYVTAHKNRITFASRNGDWQRVMFNSKAEYRDKGLGEAVCMHLSFQRHFELLVRNGAGLERDGSLLKYGSGNRVETLEIEPI